MTNGFHMYHRSLREKRRWRAVLGQFSKTRTPRHDVICPAGEFLQSVSLCRPIPIVGFILFLFCVHVYLLQAAASIASNLPLPKFQSSWNDPAVLSLGSCSFYKPSTATDGPSPAKKRPLVNTAIVTLSYLKVANNKPKSNLQFKTRLK